MQRYHMEEKDWLDIAYNHVFCRHGFVFVGRGWRALGGEWDEASERPLFRDLLPRRRLGGPERTSRRTRAARWSS